MCLCVLYKPSPSQSPSFRVWHLNTGPGSHWLISSWGWSNPSFSGSDMSTPAAVVSALQIKMSPTPERGTIAASSRHPGPSKQPAFELPVFVDLSAHLKLQDAQKLFACVSGEFGRIICSHFSGKYEREALIDLTAYRGWFFMSLKWLKDVIRLFASSPSGSLIGRIQCLLGNSLDV